MYRYEVHLLVNVKLLTVNDWISTWIRYSKQKKTLLNFRVNFISRVPAKLHHNRFCSRTSYYCNMKLNGRQVNWFVTYLSCFAFLPFTEMHTDQQHRRNRRNDWFKLYLLYFLLQSSYSRYIGCKWTTQLHFLIPPIIYRWTLVKTFSYLHEKVSHKNLESATWH